MSDISSALGNIRSSLPEGVELVAVSKFHPAEALREAYDAGQRVFGESRINELCDKIAVLPDDIQWHFREKPLVKPMAPGSIFII